MATFENHEATHDAAATLVSMLGKSLERLDRIDAYLRGDQSSPFTPPEANQEYRKLVEKATTNWLPLILSAPAQALYVDGYRSGDESENAAPWRFWQANGMDARQSAIYRAAMGYGVAYTLCRRGTDPLTGESMPSIRGVSPRKMVAAYRSPHDDWAEIGMHVLDMGAGHWSVEVFDDERSFIVNGERERSGSQWTYTSVDQGPHGASVVPIVRFPDLPDLEGRHPGMIEPLFPIQDRINQTAFDTLMTQTFASYVVRTISGMTILEEHDDQDDDGDFTAAQRAAARAAKLRISQDRMLVAEDPDTKFGTLEGSPLGPFIDAQESNVRHLAAISQTPPHHLLGQMANLSAEALVAAETSLSRKVSERQSQFGESWEQTLRLAAQIAGDMEAATDMSAEVQWRDHEARSMAATVDALGKAAEMLNVPARGLWDRLPGVTQTEIERWERLAAEGDAFGTLTDLLREQASFGGAMMPTVEQDRLAEAYRRTQLAIRAGALRDTLPLYEAASAADFPREFERLVALVRPAISLGFDRSQDAASVFFQTNRALAGFGRLDEVPAPIDLSVERLRESLRVTGPVAWAKALQTGRTVEQAKEVALVRTAGAIGRQVAAGGRQYGLDLAQADPRRPRWYRRTSARPCAFCAMLAGRGAVYASEVGGGFAAHDHCACYPVMTYDGSAPERNQRFSSQYDEAIKSARADGTLRRGTSNDLLNAFRRSYSP